MIMFLGIGLFLGSVVYGRFGTRISRYRIIFSCLILSGIIIVAFTLGLEKYPFFAFASALALLLGLVVSPIMIATNTIIHDSSSNKMMGKTFSSLEIIMHLAFLIFMFISSMLAERVSAAPILVSVGTMVGVLGFVSLVFIPKKWSE